MTKVRQFRASQRSQAVAQIWTSVQYLLRTLHQFWEQLRTTVKLEMLTWTIIKTMAYIILCHHALICQLKQVIACALSVEAEMTHFSWRML